MSTRHRISAPAVALLVALLPIGGAFAQSFGSLSSQGAPATPTSAPATPLPVTPAPAVPVPALAATAVPTATLVTAAMPGASRPAHAAAGSFDVADKVVVEKGQRRLYLLRENQVIAEYPVKLGLNPYGPKLREGDFRTPEGSYRLVRRNPRSDFFLSIQVSYPSEQDMRRARSSGTRPGGLIMIHGEPNVPRKPADYYAKNDWTDGCIAVSNADMVDIWLRTQAGIPIEIRP